MPTVQPALRSPSISSLGVVASLKKVSQKGEAPPIRRIGRVSMPGWSMSTITKLIPSRFATSKSVRTSTPHQSETSAPEVQVFWPLINQWSPLSSHLVAREARSEPAPGSE